MTDKSLIAISPWPPPMPLAKKTMCSYCCLDDPLYLVWALQVKHSLYLIVKWRKSYCCQYSINITVIAAHTSFWNNNKNKDSWLADIHFFKTIIKCPFFLHFMILCLKYSCPWCLNCMLPSSGCFHTLLLLPDWWEICDLGSMLVLLQVIY